jgi:hypothetical protein
MCIYTSNPRLSNAKFSRLFFLLVRHRPSAITGEAQYEPALLCFGNLYLSAANGSEAGISISGQFTRPNRACLTGSSSGTLPELAEEQIWALETGARNGYKCRL